MSFDNVLFGNFEDPVLMTPLDFPIDDKQPLPQVQKSLVYTYDANISIRHPFAPKRKTSILKKISNFILQDMEKQTAPHESTAQ